MTALSLSWRAYERSNFKLLTLFSADDVVADRSAMIWNKSLNEFFVLGRHLCIAIFLLTQYVKGIGPMLRGNADVVVLQPIFQHDARLVLADLYGGWMDHKVFWTLMDQVVYDKNLPGSTPQEPKKEVRTMYINDYENTTNPQMKFKWSMAQNPEDIEPEWKLLPKEYWEESERRKVKSKPKMENTMLDPVRLMIKWNNLGKSKFQ